MNIASLSSSNSWDQRAQQEASSIGDLNSLAASPNKEGGELRESFTNFVGESLFGQMLAAFRSSGSQPAYMGGGQAEKIFQGQLDQVLVQELTEASADKIAEPMFNLFQLSRQR
jgi:peptidoglycan hydrolase FlgJ